MQRELRRTQTYSSIQVMKQNLKLHIFLFNLTITMRYSREVLFEHRKVLGAQASHNTMRGKPEDSL